MKPESLTTLVKMSNTSANAASILSALRKSGHAKEVEYPSTTGSGEIKTFTSLTDQGLAFGINRSTDHPFKTEARFYPDKFPALLAVVATQIKAEAEKLLLA